MLDEAKIDALLRVASLEEFLQQLKDTPYAHLAETYDRTGDIQQVEAQLFEREVTLHREVASLLEGKHERLVLALTRKLEVENLKGVLRLWFSNSIKGQNITYRYGYLYHSVVVDPIDWSRIVNASHWHEVALALEHTVYADVLATLDSDTIAKDGMFALETALDRSWFKQARVSASQMPTRDRRILQAVLDNDADLKNIINLVRYGWLYRLPSAQLQDLMFEGGRVCGSKEFIDYLASPPENRSPITLVRKYYPKLAAKLAEEHESNPVAKQIVQVERYLGTVRRQEHMAMLRGNPFNIGTILAYFFLCERQDKMIRAIMNGLYYGWDAQTIRGFAL
jgi:V/A-type H+-transporting ATPase subunit C